jgi:hypothetical protein
MNAPSNVEYWGNNPPILSENLIELIRILYLLDRQVEAGGRMWYKGEVR